ncbi:MAG: hypothetical protein OXP66_09485 [Candidatus Tectomicrobia bacterium]|nr:hypothetical protein [Candidatus Tectomicrobia bacterium]
MFRFAEAVLRPDAQTGVVFDFGPCLRFRRWGSRGLTAGKAARFPGKRRGTAARAVCGAVGGVRQAVPGIDSPEQPDLIERGPAVAEGGYERQRGLGGEPGESGRDEER